MPLFSYLFLLVFPVFFAGMVFIFILKFIGEKYAFPLDFGLSFHGQRIFGKNKTFRGPIVMGVFTGVFGAFVYMLLPEDTGAEFFEVFVKYFIVGVTYSLGELPNSFIKRRLNIPSGKRAKGKLLKPFFILVDTFDSLVACSIAYFFLFRFPLTVVIPAILLGGIIHVATDLLMLSLKLKGAH